jgi:hypothetical protein
MGFIQSISMHRSNLSQVAREYDYLLLCRVDVGAAAARTSEPRPIFLVDEFHRACCALPVANQAAPDLAQVPTLIVLSH